MSTYRTGKYLLQGIILLFSYLFLSGVCLSDMFMAENETGNLLKNGGFEKSTGNDLSNWAEVTHGTKGGILTVIKDNTSAYSENQCVKIEAPSGVIGVMQASRIFPGKKYVARVFARGSGRFMMNLIPYKFEAYHIRGLKTEGFQNHHIFEATENWKEYTVEFTGPENVYSMNLSIQTGQTAGKGTIYIDNASLSYFHPATVRFLPSVEKLEVTLDIAPFVEKVSGNRAEISVHRQGEENSRPLLSRTVSDFEGGKASWDCSTKDLPEGNYVVKIRIKDSAGMLIVEDDDWFKKKIFDWMVNKPWISEKVPEPYNPLKAENNCIEPWGRRYAFEKSGMLRSIISQDRELLAAPVSLLAEVEDVPTEVICRSPFSFASRKDTEVSARSELAAGNLSVSLDIKAEYDGFILYRMSYKPLKGSVRLNRLRVKIPLKQEHAFLYSAGTDKHGTCILADVFPDRQGKLYDSMNDTRAGYCSPTFCSLFWVGGYDTSFCYAADSDTGWILRDDAPAVEAYREGNRIILWLNLVDREYELKGERILEFAFQAGPVKPLPKGWRGIQFDGDPDDASLTIVQAKYSGGGVSSGGGANFLYPGATEEIRERFRKMRLEEIEGGKKSLSAYFRYAMVPKGLEETEVFRSEWGIDKDTWESTDNFNNFHWQQKFYGEDKDRYILLPVNPVPSYIDCVTYGYNEVLRYLPYDGFYDDVGSPRQVYDESLGLGGRDIYGRKIYSSGLWVYRKRWKDAAYVNWLNNRPNFLRDSQHTKAHFMPAYGFVGLWSPCEYGYYNRYEDKDILEFYGSLTRYLAYNPAHQFGQIPTVGLSTRKWTESGSDRDTRCMMMVTMLHDHDVGGFGNRNIRTVSRLRRARNIFRQWEDDVRFTGYWENSGLVKNDSPDVKISMYIRMGSVLFIIGNAGETDLKTIVEPNWGRLGISKGKLQIVNTETMADVPKTGNGFKLLIPRHDIILVLAGDISSYNIKPFRVGENLPEPEIKIADYCENFKGPELPGGWEESLHKGRSGTGFVDGRLYIEGAHYGYSYIRRKLNRDMSNISVQSLVMRAPSGTSDYAGGGLALYWSNGEYLKAIPGTGQGRFIFSLSGRIHTGSQTGKASIPGWYPYRANWVKISLNPEQVRFFSSADGEKWTMEKEFERGDKYTGAPEYIILGSGTTGNAPCLSNLQAEKHFNPNNPSTTFFSDLLVGREKGEKTP